MGASLTLEPTWCTTCTPEVTRDDTRSRNHLTVKYRNTTSSEDTDGDSNPISGTGSNSSAADDNDNAASAVAYDGWKKAIESGNETLASYFMVTEYPDLDFFEYRWPKGDSALHVAVFNTKARLVLFLLTKGAPVNDQNPNTLNTPLHIAVHNDANRPLDDKIIDLLLKWGADPNVSNRMKETPITTASTFSDQTIYKSLCNNVDPTDGPKLPRGRTNSQGIKSLRNTLSIWEWKQHSLAAKSVLNDVEENEEKKVKSEVALKANMIAVSNPFTGLGRSTTAQREDLVKTNLNLKPLPVLKSWLEKRKPGVLAIYQRRWVIVKGTHLLWCSKQKEITNDANRKERKKFNGYIHFMTIDKIDIIQNSITNKHQFRVKAKDVKQGNVMRDYIFRCQSDEDRDFWVNGLKLHKKQYHTVMKYLSP